MNTTHLAKLVIVCAAGLVAAFGAQAKANVNVGLTIVSSCAVSGASLYQAASTNAAMVAGCSNETSYTVSVSPAAKMDGATSSRGAEGDHVVVTLTY